MLAPDALLFQDRQELAVWVELYSKENSRAYYLLSIFPVARSQVAFNAYKH
jgi:hypothetical protein